MIRKFIDWLYPVRSIDFKSIGNIDVKNGFFSLSLNDNFDLKTTKKHHIYIKKDGSVNDN